MVPGQKTPEGLTALQNQRPHTLRSRGKVHNEPGGWAPQTYAVNAQKRTSPSRWFQLPGGAADGNGLGRLMFILLPIPKS